MSSKINLTDVQHQGKSILRGFFRDVSPLSSNISSFNNFVDFELQKIIEENRYIEPTIIPQNIDDFKIRFDRIWIEKPEITEADGSKRNLYPHEARLRGLSYAAPVYLEISAHVNGIQRESFVTQIGSLPIMLKSKYCHLAKLNADDLIARGEDPSDPGGYFIINGTEKVLIHIEDLAANTFMVDKETIGPADYVGKIFSEYAALKIPHTFERLSDGVIYISFTRVQRAPVVLVLKSLGMLKDEDIIKTINVPDYEDDLFVNLYNYSSIQTQDDAIDTLAKELGITQPREVRLERGTELIHRFLFPHLGITPDDAPAKAKNLCKLTGIFIKKIHGVLPLDDKDHYMNKRIKMSGDLLSDLFRTNLRVLIDDLLYNFQRIVKRGKFPSIKVIIRDKLLTSRIYSAMATGNWVGGRTGISQRIDRLNYLAMLSHLQRVISPLSSSQENFEARALHATHLGRLCPIETPEGTKIGLNKNLAMLSEVSLGTNQDELLTKLTSLGLKVDVKGK